MLALFRALGILWIRSADSLDENIADADGNIIKISDGLVTHLTETKAFQRYRPKVPECSTNIGVTSKPGSGPKNVGITTKKFQSLQ